MSAAILYDSALIHGRIEATERRLAKLLAQRAGRPVVPEHGWHWCDCGRTKINTTDPSDKHGPCCPRSNRQ